MTREEALAALLERHPEWSPVGGSTGPVLAVQGPVVLYGGTGKAYRFRVRIDVPKSFPSRGGWPDVWVLESPLPFAEDAHVDGHGNLCLELPQAHEIDYEAAGLVGVLDQVTIHLDRLRIHALTGRFPGPEYEHGKEGIRQFLKEKHSELTRHLPPSLARLAWPSAPQPPSRQWCPCDSGRRLGVCHGEEIKEVRRKLAALGSFPRRAWPAKRGNPFLATKRHR